MTVPLRTCLCRAALLSVCLASCQSARPAAVASATQSFDAARAPASARGNASETARRDEGAIGLVTTLNFRQGVVLTSDRSLILRNVETNPSTGAEETNETEYTTSYTISGICAREKDELYLAGTAPNGDAVIERWTISAQNGSYYYHRIPSHTPIGQALPGVPAVQMGIEGGVFVPVASRVRSPRLNRTELLRTSTCGRIWGLGCDPEARYLLFLAGSPERKLHRFALDGSAAPVEILSSSQEPHLAACDGLSPFHATSVGRVFQITASVEPVTGGPSTTMLFDANNDGIFESSQTLTHDAYVAAGYMSGFWLTNFEIDAR